MFLSLIIKKLLKKNDFFKQGTVFILISNYNFVVKFFFDTNVTKKQGLFFCTRLKNGGGKESRVGLISAPSSGNTWTRYLLEKSSGFFTGSVYRDSRLYSKGILYKASK